jgi:hypothetical protein
MQVEYLNLYFKPGDFVTINFKNCGGYANVIKVDGQSQFLYFKKFDKTTNNIFIVLGDKNFSNYYCLTQYGIYVFLNSHLKLL